MSERREFVKVERMGDKARYSVEIPITTETIHNRMDELEQRISDVNDAALYDFAMLEKRIDELEQRVDGNTEQIRHDWNAHFRHYGYLEERLTNVEERIDALERKLNHKGGSE